MTSENMQKYFEYIENSLKEAYDMATEARSKGYDPEKNISSLLTKNMAERVVGIISVVAPQVIDTNIVHRIKELETEYGMQNWRVAFKLAEEVSDEKFCKFKDKKEAMEVGLRFGLAYITNGVVSSPLEGFVRLELKKRRDGKEYFCLYFGGPIRSAGTTATCIFVAIADYIRKRNGYEIYDPTHEEIKRSSTELLYFHERITNLQYLPSEQEIEFLTSHLPVQIDGDPSEEIEVPNYKNLERVKSNKLRNGYCLVMAEGLSQKLPKFWGKFSKFNKELGMDHWNFLEEYIKLQKEMKAKGQIKKDSTEKITPNFTYIKDLVAGRPVLGYPLRKGGFRLRFGRTRVSGFSSEAISPATMYILNNYIAIGTQLRTERPNKSTVLGVCDYIEGPIVKLKNGSVVFIENEEQAKALVGDVEEILFLGDILINYGDFLVFNHLLVPPGYCEEWWALELEKELKNKEGYEDLLKNPIKAKISADQAIEISKKYKIPLHPRYTYHWADINIQKLLSVIDWLVYAVITPDKIILPLKYDVKKDLVDVDPKRVFELLGIPHKLVSNEYIVIDGDWAKALAVSLGFYEKKFDVNHTLKKVDEKKDVLEIINKLSDVKIRDKSGIFIGSRMGRPEKAKIRKMIGSPHVLFPVGEEGGKLRCFKSSCEAGTVTAEFSMFYCEKCNRKTIYPRCENCDSETKPLWLCSVCGELKEKCKNTEHKCVRYSKLPLDINHYLESAIKTLELKEIPELIKGVKGTSNRDHFPENLVKGILRSAHNIYVNKDGTIRYDMTETAITHFKPKEIGTSVERLKELGYEKDIYGNELKDKDQILELKCQDIILPSCQESFDEGADLILFRISKFIDDLLVKLYKQKPYYNLKDKSELVGHLIIAISPHTVAGIIGRIIGFSRTQGFYAHPLFHSQMRRDIDGDEAGIMLLMDAFLNFSRGLLGTHRGATQDEPLVLSSLIVPAEVDDMVFDMDTCWKYPLEFYEACMEYKHPSEIKLETFRTRLGTDAQYEGLGFTHHTSDINSGVRCSGYKTIPTMEEKVFGQMQLAEKIRAVDETDVAALIINRHFLRDIKGNLRKFSQQEFRCVKCNEKFRRPSLKGVCTKCGGKIIFTVAEGSVTKYLTPSISLAEKYELPAYLRQDLELTKQRIESMFGRDKERQEGLGRWFG
ncbi:DNA polymerase II large subunit [Candidatus Woesearchaeota archaeon]|nr:DNA polymerase II large subunit [Candidatus Woesearchaeota archaeon]